jgi:hypothetical protein
MALADCGGTFYVQQKSGRPFVVFLIVATLVLALVMFLGVYVLPLLPTVLWVFALSRIGEARGVAYVVVAMDRVTSGARSICFADVRVVRSRGSRVVLRSARYALTFDASLLDSFARLCLVRHIEARVLLARSARGRARAERTALEAFHVFRGAHAVRIHKRRVAELLDGEGPWASSRKGRVYVRCSPSAPPTAYRTNARTNAIEVGSLENEFAEAVR